MSRNLQCIFFIITVKQNEKQKMSLLCMKIDGLLNDTEMGKAIIYDSQISRITHQDEN